MLFVYLLLSLVFLDFKCELVASFDFEKVLEGDFTGRYDNVPHNGVIVPCPSLTTKSHCLFITKQTYGGDLFSRAIEIQDNDSLTVTFDYLWIKYDSQQKHSGGYFGWENGREWQWSAMADPTIAEKSNPSYLPVQIKEIANTWIRVIKQIFLQKKQVSYQIHPKENLPIRLVIENFIDGGGADGDFLVDNITVTRKSQCSNNCIFCEQFFTCLGCQPNYGLWKGNCIAEQCQSQINRLSPRSFEIPKFDETNQVYQIAVRNASFDECMEVLFNGQVFIPQQVKEDVFINIDVTSSQLSTYGCLYQDQSYLCDFKLELNLYQTKLSLFTIKWKQTFNISMDIVQKISDYKSLQQIINVGESEPIIITLNSRMDLCIDSQCTDFINNTMNSTPFTLTVNQKFYVLLELVDPEYNNFQLAYDKGFVTGNGTQLSLILVSSTKVTNQSIILCFTIPLVVIGGYLSFSAKVVQTRRFLQPITNLNQPKGYIITQSRDVQVLEALDLYQFEAQGFHILGYLTLISISLFIICSMCGLFCRQLCYNKKDPLNNLELMPMAEEHIQLFHN